MNDLREHRNNRDHAYDLQNIEIGCGDPHITRNQRHIIGAGRGSRQHGNPAGQSTELMKQGTDYNAINEISQHQQDCRQQQETKIQQFLQSDRTTNISTRKHLCHPFQP